MIQQWRMCQIDESGTPEDTKFLYLKELVDLKVRNLIDGLILFWDSLSGWLKRANKERNCGAHGPNLVVINTT